MSDSGAEARCHTCKKPTTSLVKMTTGDIHDICYPCMVWAVKELKREEAVARRKR